MHVHVLSVYTILSLSARKQLANLIWRLLRSRGALGPGRARGADARRDVRRAWARAGVEELRN